MLWGCALTLQVPIQVVSGACILLEHLLGRDLLYLACRHHILELVASSACTEMMGTLSAPEILLCKRFQAKWKCVNQAESLWNLNSRPSQKTIVTRK